MKRYIAVVLLGILILALGSGNVAATTKDATPFFQNVDSHANGVSVAVVLWSEVLSPGSFMGPLRALTGLMQVWGCRQTLETIKSQYGLDAHIVPGTDPLGFGSDSKLIVFNTQRSPVGINGWNSYLANVTNESQVVVHYWEGGHPINCGGNPPPVVGRQPSDDGEVDEFTELERILNSPEKREEWVSEGMPDPEKEHEPIPVGFYVVGFFIAIVLVFGSIVSKGVYAST